MSTPDCFRSRLDQMIKLVHPLAELATRLSWSAIEAAVAPKLAHLPGAPNKAGGGRPEFDNRDQEFAPFSFTLSFLIRNEAKHGSSGELPHS
jgi:IS5 family transposase